MCDSMSAMCRVFVGKRREKGNVVSLEVNTVC